MKPQPTHGSAQLEQALALVELLRDYELPPVSWTLASTSAALTGAIATDNARPTLAAYAAALNGRPLSPDLFTAADGKQRVAQCLVVAWRGVQVNLIATSDLSAYPELMDAAADVAGHSPVREAVAA
ncbi:hypothetical protein GCM10010193_69330 [Kitasatospora atroaurantiaca]|uniref:Uncharacterized protein n=1 Tax=Kitasatospora atroaurantiaca TaxID=285545 RepID=A0A561EN65_9ACTN|nr:hypothetical protein [Kitasatospora atroaurantiaca]TWE17022.1 hypothetical protein FB465_2024 [Kitasatospora atroaurantiaca]